MVGGRSRGSPGMVLTVVLLMVMAAQTKGKSQLSIVEDIDKSLDNILRDVQSLYGYIDPSTTSRESTTYVDSSSTDFSSTTTDTTTISVPVETTSTTTASPASTASTTTASPASTAPTTTASPASTTSTTTASPTTTTYTTTTIPTTTTSTTTAIPTTTTSTTTEIPTTTTSTTTTIPTPTTSTTTTTHPTTSTTTSTDPTEPGGPKSNDRVKRRNLLSLATLDEVLSAWVDPRSTWLEDKMSIETSDETSNVTSDIPSLESTKATSTAVTTPVSDITRLETALNETHVVVTKVAAGTITEDQVTQMQTAEAEVKDVTVSPDEALKEQLQNEPHYLDTLIEKIKKDQETITETREELKKRSTGIIVGSVLGGLVLVVLVAVGAVWYVRRSKKMKAGGRAAAKKRSQSAAASSQQQMVELRTDHGMEDPYPPDELRPHSRTPPNPLIPRANFDNFSLSSAQRNNPPESSRIPVRESPMQVSEMKTEHGIENPGYVEELPRRPVVPPKPRNRPSTFDDFGVSPNQIGIRQEPSRADVVPSEQTHYIDELNYRLAPRERQVGPIGENYPSPTEPIRRSHRDRSPRQHQHHHRPRNHDHRMKHRNDHHVRRTPSMPPPDYTIPRRKHQSPDNFNSRKPHSQKQRPPRSPYEFEAPQRPSAPPESEPRRPERNRSDIRRPYGPEDLY